MFDIGFSELLVIGVVALIVLGPERLPKVARTAGLLFARFQRYVSEVKSEINREIQNEELKSLQTSFQEAKEAISEAQQSITKQASETEHMLKTLPESATNSLEFVEEPTAHEASPPEPTPQLELPLPGAPPAPEHASAAPPDKEPAPK
jgi:sec-independent protein translocase protein TatB